MTRRSGAARSACALAVLALAMQACGEDPDSPGQPEGQPTAEAVQPAAAHAHMTCEDRIVAAGSQERAGGGTRLGPVEIVGLSRLARRSAGLRGGVKVPLLVEPDQSAAVELRAPERTAAFVLRPEGEFPPGRPSPLPPASAARITIASCPRGPSEDPRNFYPLFVAVEGATCAQVVVTDARGAEHAREVSIGGARRCASGTT